MDREILVNNKIHVAQLPMNLNSFFSEQCSHLFQYHAQIFTLNLVQAER